MDRIIDISNINNKELIVKIKEIKLNINKGTKKKLVTAIEIIDIINKNINEDLEISIIGPGRVLIEIEEQNKKSKIVLFLKLFIGSTIVLFGSALAIMYFHGDVNMNVIHSAIYKIFTGEESSRPLLVNIPYSIGIGIGIIIFFNLFSKKKDQKPTPLDLEVYGYENEMYEYYKDEEQSENEN